MIARLHTRCAYNSCVCSETVQGFGFLTMATPAAASAVLHKMHGSRLDGKQIVVKPAGLPPGRDGPVRWGQGKGCGVGATGRGEGWG